LEEVPKRLGEVFKSPEEAFPGYFFAEATRGLDDYGVEQVKS
jgi:hypothetical protein